MKKSNEFIDFYSGTEVSINRLKSLLESVGVFGIVQNDFNSGIMSGFFGGTADSIRLKIRASDVEKASPILEEFLNPRE